MTVSVTTLLLALAAIGSGNPTIEPVERVWSSRGDTLEILVPAGDTAQLQLGQSLFRIDKPRTWCSLRGATLRLQAVPAGTHILRLKSLVGRPTKVVVVDGVEPKKLGLQLVPLAIDPVAWTDSVKVAGLRRELSILMQGTGIELNLSTSRPVRLPPPPSFWDPAGSGHLDLLRNDDSLHPAPALDSLAAWMAARSLVFPKVAIFQDRVRVGWALGISTSPGDSLLVLANQTTFPWRDGRGGATRYVLANARGQHADTFQVTGYRGDTMLVRTTATDGRFRFSHDRKTDFVLRPDQSTPPFGVSPSWRSGASPLILLPDGRQLLDPKRAARVIAHEICHTLGLRHRDEKSNLMSPILRMDVDRQYLSPDQVLLLHKGLKPFL